jgi:hypothetical protein
VDHLKYLQFYGTPFSEFHRRYYQSLSISSVYAERILCCEVDAQLKFVLVAQQKRESQSVQEISDPPHCYKHTGTATMFIKYRLMSHIIKKYMKTPSLNASQS